MDFKKEITICDASYVFWEYVKVALYRNQSIINNSNYGQQWIQFYKAINTKQKIAINKDIVWVNDEDKYDINYPINKYKHQNDKYYIFDNVIDLIYILGKTYAQILNIPLFNSNMIYQKRYFLISGLIQHIEQKYAMSKNMTPQITNIENLLDNMHI